MKLYEALTELKRNNFEGCVIPEGQIGMWSWCVIADAEGHLKSSCPYYYIKHTKGRALSICGSAERTDNCLRVQEWNYVRTYKEMFNVYLEGIKNFHNNSWFRKEVYDKGTEEALKKAVKKGKLTVYEAEALKEKYDGIVNSI